MSIHFAPPGLAVGDALDLDPAVGMGPQTEWANSLCEFMRQLRQLGPLVATLRVGNSRELRERLHSRSENLWDMRAELCATFPDDLDQSDETLVAGMASLADEVLTAARKRLTAPGHPLAT